MAFKTLNDYNEQRFGGLFTLRNDREYADVVFLYPSVDDVLIADTHYIKSPDYSGYVHCTGRGCPACAKNIRVQTKLFIPLYLVQTDEVVFWDRNIRFENQLHLDVFANYPNPSEFVFRITRHGAAGDVNTTYEIKCIAQNTVKSYADICVKHGVAFPDYYSKICREYSALELGNLLAPTSPAASYEAPLVDYPVTPRVAVPAMESSKTDDFIDSIADVDPLDSDTPDF